MTHGMLGELDFLSKFQLPSYYGLGMNMLRRFSKYRLSGPMLSIGRNVHMCVCLFLCLFVCSLLRYRLNVFLPPFPEVGCQSFLELRNPWGKVMERSGLTFEQFCLEVV